MRYAANSVGSAYLPKLLGIYERELTPMVETACARKPRLIVDVGAAEGYYAVGLGIKNSGARIVAFEMDPKGRAALHEMARINNVRERIEIRGKCEQEDLRVVLAAEVATLIVCDVEGYEENLLDPQAVPVLRGAMILAEMHEFILPGITQLLRKRFEGTHKVERVWQEPRSREEFPWRTLGTALLPKSYLDWAVSEWRPERMSWLWMEPK